MAEDSYQNYFMKAIEQKYMGKNPIKRLISHIKYRKFLSKIQHWSPSIGMLWFFADFVKIAERVYFYDNKKGNYLFSSNKYSFGENGFIIVSQENSLEINCKLFTDSQRVVIEVRHMNGSTMTSIHKFENNQWAYEMDKYDEVLIDNIIGIINLSMIKLVHYCWVRKGTYDHFKIKNL